MAAQFCAATEFPALTTGRSAIAEPDAAEAGVCDPGEVRRRRSTHPPAGPLVRHPTAPARTNEGSPNPTQAPQVRGHRPQLQRGRSASKRPRAPGARALTHCVRPDRAAYGCLSLLRSGSCPHRVSAWQRKAQDRTADKRLHATNMATGSTRVPPKDRAAATTGRETRAKRGDARLPAGRRDGHARRVWSPWEPPPPALPWRRHGMPRAHDRPLSLRRSGRVWLLRFCGALRGGFR